MDQFPKLSPEEILAKIHLGGLDQCLQMRASSKWYSCVHTAYSKTSIKRHGCSRLLGKKRQHWSFNRDFFLKFHTRPSNSDSKQVDKKKLYYRFFSEMVLIVYQRFLRKFQTRLFDRTGHLEYSCPRFIKLAFCPLAATVLRPHFRRANE